MSEFFDRSFLQNIVASAVYSALLVALAGARNLIRDRYPKVQRLVSRGYFVTAISSFAILNIYCISSEYASQSALTIFVVSTAVLTYFLWKELAQFWGVGLIGGDRSVVTGVNYDKALRLCRNELEFLGIGAAKLTSSKEFDAAIARCHRPNTAVRFLLLNPNSPLLTKAAHQRGVCADEYRRKVEISLKQLAKAKMERHMNIEVRFYPLLPEGDLPLFRLMFIDDSLCLVSYNVFGEGDGSQSPQLHVERFYDQRDVSSFYHPFKVYYDQLWDRSTPWDFNLPVHSDVILNHAPTQ